MAKILAFCGLDCGECEAYIATQMNDRPGLEATAKKWAEQFGATNINADMCICDGCPSGKKASAAHAVTCAHCPDYGCETLKGFFAFAPVLKDKLEAIRKEIGK